MKLDQIPYLSYFPRDGRILLLQPWYDFEAGTWHMYSSLTEDDCVRLQMASMTAGTYYARRPAHPKDIIFDLGTLIAQHLSFPAVVPRFYSLVDDIQLLSASLEKLELIRQSVKEPMKATFLIVSEVEYLFMLVRSMYDLLQKIAKELGKLLCRVDGSPVLLQLPDSFAQVILDGDAPRTEAELITKFRLPKQLASFYVHEISTFVCLRDIRVSIEHHGKPLPSVYITENGPGISTEGPPGWTALPVWKMHDLLPNGVGSVRALTAFLAKSFISTLNTFAQALRAVIAPALLPTAVSDGNDLYLTNPTIHQLSGLDVIITSPWNTDKSTSHQTGS